MINDDIIDYKNEILSCRHRLLKVRDNDKIREVILDRINHYEKLLEEIDNDNN